MKSMKVLKSLLIVGLLCSMNGIIVRADDEDEKQVEPLQTIGENVKVASGSDVGATKKIIVNVNTDVAYSSLKEAVEHVEDGEILKLNGNIDDAVGISVPSGKNFTIDFGGYTYTLLGQGAGSSGTETNGFQFLKDSNIVMKNGIIRISKDAINIKRIIQNYADLTLEDMIFYTENQVGGEKYAFSLCNGNIVFTGNTSIISKDDNVVSFIAGNYADYPATHVVFDKNFTGRINGILEWSGPNVENYSMLIKGRGTFGGLITTQGDEAEGCKVYSGTFPNGVDSKYLVEGTAFDSSTGTVIPSEDSVVSIDSVGYNTLKKAINAVESGETITVLKDIPNAEGVKIESGKNFTIDFNGYTYTLTGPGAGSFGTETIAFQLLKGTNVKLKDGIIKVAENPKNIKRFIQNYGNLILDDMIFDTDNLPNANDAISLIYGEISICGNTSIVTDSPNDEVMLVAHFGSYDMVKVTFEDNFMGNIGGKIVYDLPESDKDFIKINGNGTFVGIEKYSRADADFGEAENQDIMVNSGSFLLDVKDYISDEVAYIKTDGIYHVGTQKEVEEKAEKATTSLEIIQGITELNGIKDGVSVKNGTDIEISINGKKIEVGQEITTKPQIIPPTKPDHRPSGGGSSSDSSSNSSATTESGNKVEIETVKPDKVVNETLGKENVITSVQVEKTEEKVEVTVKAGKKLADQTVYVVQQNPDTGAMELVAASVVDESGEAVFTTDSTEVLTVTTSLPKGFISTADKENKVTYYINEEGNFQKGWLEDESGDWYYFDEENAQMLQERWGASATDWYFMGSDGKMLTNQWVAASDGRWYYVGSDGAMVVNVMIDGCWINEEGVYYSPIYS